MITMQLPVIFCVTGTCMFINLCNLWGKKHQFLLKQQPTCSNVLVENTMTYSLTNNISLSQPCNNVFLIAKN